MLKDLLIFPLLPIARDPSLAQTADARRKRV